MPLRRRENRAPVAGLKPLKLARVPGHRLRRVPHGLPQRSKVLGLLVGAGIGTSDDANTANRLRVARFSVTKTFTEFSVSPSSVSKSPFRVRRLAGVVRANENL